MAKTEKFYKMWIEEREDGSYRFEYSPELNNNPILEFIELIVNVVEKETAEAIFKEIDEIRYTNMYEDVIRGYEYDEIKKKFLGGGKTL